MNIKKNIDYGTMFSTLDVLMTTDLPHMELYYEIGRVVSDNQEKGAAIAAAEYLQSAYPDMIGFSPRNLRRMREFYRTYGSELMTQDEIAVMDGGKCILQLRGVRPFFSDKYDITKHPNYKYLSDADPRNAFNIEKFLSTQLRPKPEESYEVFEINVDEEDGDGEDGIPAFVPDL